MNWTLTDLSPLGKVSEIGCCHSSVHNEVVRAKENPTCNELFPEATLRFMTDVEALRTLDRMRLGHCSGFEVDTASSPVPDVQPREVRLRSVSAGTHLWPVRRKTRAPFLKGWAAIMSTGESGSEGSDTEEGGG